MSNFKQAAWDAIRNEPSLTGEPSGQDKIRLAENPPYTDPTGTLSRSNSVIPAGKADASTATPFLTIQSGNHSKLDALGHIYDEFLYIRCYNDPRKAYVEIDTILDRIRRLLDRANLDVNDGGNVYLTYEATDPEREDDAISLNYRESRYRIRLI